MIDEKTRKKLEDTFPEGQYAQLTILVRLDELEGLIEHLRKANLNLAVLPHVQQAMDFELANNDDGVLN